MKTLSTNQIQNIEEFLISQYNIKYQDTRDEVLDHIACEIEELMNKQNTFEEASDIVFKKWHTNLSPSKGFNLYNIPSFLAKPWIIRDTIITAIVIIIGSILSFVYGNNIIQNSNPTVITLITFICSSTITWYAFTKTKHKSGYRAVLLKNNIKLYQLIITLYSLVTSIPFIGFSYKNLPIILLFCTTQLYYLNEVRKIKPYKII